MELSLLLSKIVKDKIDYDDKKKAIIFYLKHCCNLENGKEILDSEEIKKYVTEADIWTLHKMILQSRLIIIYGTQHDIKSGFKFLEREDMKKYFSKEELKKMHEDIQTEYDYLREI